MNKFIDTCSGSQSEGTVMNSPADNLLRVQKLYTKLNFVEGVDVNKAKQEGFETACRRGELIVAQWLHSLGGIDIHANNNGYFNDINGCQYAVSRYDPNYAEYELLTHQNQLMKIQWLYSIGGFTIEDRMIHNVNNNLPYLQWLSSLKTFSLEVLYKAFELHCLSGNFVVVRYLHQLVNIQGGSIPPNSIKNAFSSSSTNKHYNVAHWLVTNFEVDKEHHNYKNYLREVFPWFAQHTNLNVLQNFYYENQELCMNPTLIKYNFETYTILSEAFKSACYGNKLENAQFIASLETADVQIDYFYSLWLSCRVHHFEIVQWIESTGKCVFVFDYHFLYAVGGACTGNNLPYAKYLWELLEQAKQENRTVGYLDLDSNIANEICEQGYVEVAQWMYSIGWLKPENIPRYFRSACGKNQLIMAQWLYSFGLVDINQNDNSEHEVLSMMFENIRKQTLPFKNVDDNTMDLASMIVGLRHPDLYKMVLKDVDEEYEELEHAMFKDTIFNLMCRLGNCRNGFMVDDFRRYYDHI